MTQAALTADGVFIGGGHNALVAAGYLAGAGADVVVVDANDAAGGGLLTAELTEPGFHHNLAAYFSRWTPQYRIWKDLELDRHGLSAIVPDVQVSLPLEGGGGLVLYRDVAASVDAIRQFSVRDAATWERVYPQCLMIARDVAGAMRFSPPMDRGERDALLRQSEGGRLYLDFERQAPLDLVRDLFEHEVVRSALLFNITTRAYLPLLKTPGTGYIVALAIAAAHNTAVHPGGGPAVARALTSAVTSRGGRVITRARVERVLVDGGRAVGVELSDGRAIAARRFVCSGIPAPVTLGALIDPAHVPSEVRASLERYRWQADSIFAVHLALREAPRYNGHAALSEGLNVCVGAESSDAWEAQHHAILDGALPDIGMECAVPSLFDAGAAPAGHAIAFAWQLVPREPSGGGAARWNGADAETFAARMIDRWRAYAPNLARAEIARAVHHPLDMARAVPSFVLGDRHHGSYHPDNFDENRPHASLSGYRTPIDGLYLCGSSSYPGGSLTGQPGYNSAGVIAGDHGLPRWWNPVPARESLARLS